MPRILMCSNILHDANEAKAHPKWTRFLAGHERFELEDGVWVWKERVSGTPPADTARIVHTSARLDIPDGDPMTPRHAMYCSACPDVYPALIDASLRKVKITPEVLSILEQLKITPDQWAAVTNTTLQYSEDPHDIDPEKVAARKAQLSESLESQK